MPTVARARAANGGKTMHWCSWKCKWAEWKNCRDHRLYQGGGFSLIYLLLLPVLGCVLIIYDQLDSVLSTFDYKIGTPLMGRMDHQIYLITPRDPIRPARNSIIAWDLHIIILYRGRHLRRDANRMLHAQKVCLMATYYKKLIGMFWVSKICPFVPLRGTSTICCIESITEAWVVRCWRHFVFLHWNQAQWFKSVKAICRKREMASPLSKMRLLVKRPIKWRIYFGFKRTSPKQCCHQSPRARLWWMLYRNIFVIYMLCLKNLMIHRPLLKRLVQYLKI